jgi:hypothetical protein
MTARIGDKGKANALGLEKTGGPHRLQPIQRGEATALSRDHHEVDV